MPAKIVTLSVKDQDLLRVALNRAVEWPSLMGNALISPAQTAETTERIKDLRDRLV